jgi:hypothetical protein
LRVQGSTEAVEKNPLIPGARGVDSVGKYPFMVGKPWVEWWDTRIGGLARRQWLPEGKELPDIPAEFQHAVIFLGCRRGGVDPVGTAFFVSSPVAWNPEAFPPEEIPPLYPSDSERFGWLVTARHVIEGIADTSDDGKVLLMVNSKDGARVDPYPETDITEWFQMPDDEDTGYLADVALLPFVRPPNYAIAPVPIEASLTPSRRQHADVSPGADVVYPSLYYQYSGRKRNTPLIRIGTVAAVADHAEPVELHRYAKEVFAHLVEARSYNGVSGSPVFVVMPAARFRQSGDPDVGTVISMTSRREFYLLGLMITHFGIEDVQDSRELVNLGLAVVLDSSYIWKGIRMAMEDGKGKLPEPDLIEGVAGMDSVEPETAYTSEDFDADLRKATRRTGGEPDQEPKRTSE